MKKTRIRDLQPGELVADAEAISCMLGDVPVGTLQRWAQADGWPRRHSTTSRGRRTEYSIAAAKATYQRLRDTMNEQIEQILRAIDFAETRANAVPHELRLKPWTHPGGWIMHGYESDRAAEIAQVVRHISMPNAEAIAEYVASNDPSTVLRRCEHDRLTVGFCREVLSIGTSAAAQTLARLVLTNLAQAYGVADTPPKTEA